MSDYLPVPREEFPKTPSRSVVNASYLLMAGTLLLVMWQGLLPGLLSVCVGFMLTRALARLLATLHDDLGDVAVKGLHVGTSDAPDLAVEVFAADAGPEPR